MNLSEVEPNRRAQCAIDGIVAQRRAWDRTNRRPRSLSAREALMALQFESLFVAVAASNIAAGVELTDQDRERLLLAASRIDTIATEAAG